MAAFNHSLAQSLFLLDTFNLFNHLDPEMLVIFLVLCMLSELASGTASASHDRLLLDGIERTFNGLGNGMLVSKPCCLSGGRECGSVGEGDLVEFHAVQKDDEQEARGER